MEEAEQVRNMLQRMAAYQEVIALRAAGQAGLGQAIAVAQDDVHLLDQVGRASGQAGDAAGTLDQRRAIGL